MGGKELRVVSFFASALSALGYLIYLVATYGMHPLCKEVSNPIIDHVILPVMSVAYLVMIFCGLLMPTRRDS